MLVPCVMGGQMSLKECAAVCIRVQYMGEEGRPTVTWGCSCSDFHLFRDHCTRSDVRAFRRYPHSPACMHEQAVAQELGPPDRMLGTLL
jgi:hypothetical protein